MTTRARYDVVVVGAGFAGATFARCAAEELGQRVLVIDQRAHVAGNAYDVRDEHGVLCHAYGPHIFHTNAPRVRDFLSRFTAWRPYEHRVLAEVDGRFVPMPVNRTTVNELYGLQLATESDMEAFLAARAEPVDAVHDSEQVVVAKIGRDLYERLFRGYTRKHWGLDPSQLHASVCARIPVRLDEDDRYFTDAFQAMPAAGYTAMFERMLDHPNIELALGAAYEDLRPEVEQDLLVWTGPIDEYFGHRFGALPYRSLRFETETRATPDGGLVQPVAQVNYPNERIPFTRVTEYRHLTGQDAAVSTLAYEFPSDEGEPYYPVPQPANRELYHRYELLARRTPGVVFIGRLARYQYLNMDQVVAGALQSFDRHAEHHGGRSAQRPAA